MIFPQGKSNKFWRFKAISAILTLITAKKGELRTIFRKLIQEFKSSVGKAKKTLLLDLYGYITGSSGQAHRYFRLRSIGEYMTNT